MKHFALAVIAGLSLAACQTTTSGTATQSTNAPTWLSIVDKTLLNGADGETEVVLRSNGTIGGNEDIVGTWEERDGKYCRTLTEPERFAGTECQMVTLNGNEVTFESPGGRTSTWDVQ